MYPEDFHHVRKTIHIVDKGGGRPERCGVPVEKTRVTREARRPGIE